MKVQVMNGQATVRLSDLGGGYSIAFYLLISVENVGKCFKSIKAFGNFEIVISCKSFADTASNISTNLIVCSIWK